MAPAVTDIVQLVFWQVLADRGAIVFDLAIKARI